MKWMQFCYVQDSLDLQLCDLVEKARNFSVWLVPTWSWWFVEIGGTQRGSITDLHLRPSAVAYIGSVHSNGTCIICDASPCRWELFLALLMAWKDTRNRLKLWFETVVESTLTIGVVEDWSNADVSLSLSLSPALLSIAECMASYRWRATSSHSWALTSPACLPLRLPFLCVLLLYPQGQKVWKKHNVFPGVFPEMFILWRCHC